MVPRSRPPEGPGTCFLQASHCVRGGSGCSPQEEAASSRLDPQDWSGALTPPEQQHAGQALGCTCNELAHPP